MDLPSPPGAAHEGSPPQPQQQLVIRSDRNITPFEQAQKLDVRDDLSTHFGTEKRFLSSAPAQLYRPRTYAPQFSSEQQVVTFHQPHATNVVSYSGLSTAELQGHISPHENASIVPVFQNVEVSRSASNEQRHQHEEDASSAHLPRKLDSNGSGSEEDYQTGSSDSNFPERKWSPAAAVTAYHDQDPRPAYATRLIAKPVKQKQPTSENAPPQQQRRQTHSSTRYSTLQDEPESVSEESPVPKMEQQKHKKSQDLHPLECLERSIAHKMTLKLWLEEERLLRSRAHDQEAFCRSTERDVYLILALNFLFQALSVAGAAQTSALDCSSSWAPLIMSLIVSVAAFLATLQKLEAREHLLSQLRAYRADTRVIMQYIDRLRSMGDLFDLLDLPQLASTPLSKATSSSFPRNLICGFAIFVLITLSLFSVITFVSFRAILCHH